MGDSKPRPCRIMGFVFRERVSSLLLCISLDALLTRSSVIYFYQTLFSFFQFIREEKFEATKLINQRDRQSGI